MRYVMFVMSPVVLRHMRRVVVRFATMFFAATVSGMTIMT